MTQPIDAIALGGGGSRGSFEVGALAYLYAAEEMAPRVLTGCSIGAVVAARLATSAVASDQARMVGELASLIRGFPDHTGMFAEEPWFADVIAALPAAGRAIRQLRGTPAPESAPSLPLPRSVISPASTGDPGNRGFSEVWGALRTLARTARELEPSVRAAFKARSLYNLDPLNTLLTDPEVFDLGAVGTSGMTLRLPVVSLEAGELRFVTEAGTFVDRDNCPLPQLGTVAISDAVRASAAVPGVFPSIRLGTEHYVDGGVREILPLNIATDHLGAVRTVAILAQAPGLAPRPDLDVTTILPVVARALAEISLEEIRRGDVARARHNPGVTVIEPEINVHGSFEVDPALIGIAIDYGYMRAADVMTDADHAERDRATTITQIRMAGAAEGRPQWPDGTEASALLAAISRRNVLPPTLARLRPPLLGT